MALNSITLDGEVIQTVSIAKLRHMPKAYVFMLRYFERTPADSHHAEIYLVYAPAPSPEGESLQHFNPKLGQYIGFIGKIRGVEQIEWDHKSKTVPLIQLTQWQIPDKPKAC